MNEGPPGIVSPAGGTEEGREISDHPIYVLRSKTGQTELTQGEVLVGRSRSCQVVLRDPSVSRSHALINVSGRAVSVKDLASSNGTFVNGKRVEGEQELRAGDELTFGESALQLEELSTEEDYSFAGLLEELEGEESGVPGGIAAGDVLETIQPRHTGDRAAAGPGPAKEEEEEVLVADGGLPEPVFEPLLEELDRLGADDEEGEDTPSPSSSPSSSATAPAPPELAIEMTPEPEPELSLKMPEPARPPGPPSPAPRPPSPRPPAPQPPPPRPPEPQTPPREEPPPEPAPPVPPRRPPTSHTDVSDIAPALGEASLLEVVDRLRPYEGGEASGTSPTVSPRAPQQDTGPEDDTGELLPSLEDLDALTSPAPPSRSSPAASSGAAAVYRDRMPSPKAKGGPAPAGFGIRLVAGLMDLLLVMLVAGGVSLLAGGPWQQEGGTLLGTVGFGMSLVIHVFGWTLFGTSPGKRLFGLYVCPVGGSPGLGAGRALLRYLGYGVTACSLGLGFLMVAFTPGRRALHDVIAGTFVTRED